MRMVNSSIPLLRKGIEGVGWVELSPHTLTKLRARVIRVSKFYTTCAVYSHGRYQQKLSV